MLQTGPPGGRYWATTLATRRAPGTSARGRQVAVASRPTASFIDLIEMDSEWSLRILRCLFHVVSSCFIFMLFPLHQLHPTASQIWLWEALRLLRSDGELVGWGNPEKVDGVSHFKFFGGQQRQRLVMLGTYSMYLLITPIWEQRGVYTHWLTDSGTSMVSVLFQYASFAYRLQLAIEFWCAPVSFSAASKFRGPKEIVADCCFPDQKVTKGMSSERSGSSSPDFINLVGHLPYMQTLQSSYSMTWYYRARRGRKFAKIRNLWGLANVWDFMDNKAFQRQIDKRWETDLTSGWKLTDRQTDSLTPLTIGWLAKLYYLTIWIYLAKRLMSSLTNWLTDQPTH